MVIVVICVYCCANLSAQSVQESSTISRPDKCAGDVNLDEDFGLRRVCFSEVKWWICHARYEQSCSKVKENKLKLRQNKLSIF